MAVVLDVTQSGSGSTKISAQPGDTITIELASTVESSVLANAVAQLAGLSAVTGVNFVANTSGGAT